MLHYQSHLDMFHNPGLFKKTIPPRGAYRLSTFWSNFSDEGDRLTALLIWQKLLAYSTSPNLPEP